MRDKTNRDKPEGTYRCLVCEKYWDGNEVYRDPQFLAGQRLICGDLFCGANVIKISALPKKEYQKSLDSRLEAK